MTTEPSTDRMFEDSGEEKNDLLAAVASIFDETGIEMKSVLSQRQVVRLAVAKKFANNYNVPVLDDLCDLLMMLKVSQKGTGRRDLRTVLSSKFRRLDESADGERKTRRLLGI